MIKRETIGMIIAALGIFDTLILLDESYNASGICGPGGGSLFGTPIDCGYVVQSEYSKFLGQPLALWGFLFYLSMFLLFFFYKTDRKYFPEILLIGSITGIVASSAFVYLQFAVLKLVCLYCMGSALTSTLLLVLMGTSYKILKENQSS